HVQSSDLEDQGELVEQQKKLSSTLKKQLARQGSCGADRARQSRQHGQACQYRQQRDYHNVGQGTPQRDLPKKVNVQGQSCQLNEHRQGGYFCNLFRQKAQVLLQAIAQSQTNEGSPKGIDKGIIKQPKRIEQQHCRRRPQQGGQALPLTPGKNGDGAVKIHQNRPEK